MKYQRQKLALQVMRRLDPDMTAAKIRSVQTSIEPFVSVLTTKGWLRKSNGEYVVRNVEIIEWIISHDSALWEAAGAFTFTFNEEMEMLFLLRWS